MKRMAWPLLAAAALAGAALVSQAQAPPAPRLPNADAEAKGKYKKSTWTAFHKRNALKPATTRQAQPEATDCPPLPVLDCLDTWM